MNEKSETTIESFENAMHELSKSEAKVARFFIQNHHRLSLETGSSVSEKTGVSEITVSRFLRKFGIQGMNGLREALHRDLQNEMVGTEERQARLEQNELGDFIRNEAEALVDLAAQVGSETWKKAVSLIDDTDLLYVTGFQTVRGLSEDFVRRLSIVRGGVQFISVHDSNLAEWLPSQRQKQIKRGLILVDIIPYAREAERLANYCAQNDISLVVVTDEMNSWAQNYTEYVFYARSKVGTMLDTTGVLTSLLNLLTHAIAANNPSRTKTRLAEWPRILQNFEIY